jgi:antitoxin component YwqK of YwqJK toxin-antitoxin module
MRLVRNKYDGVKFFYNSKTPLFCGVELRPQLMYYRELISKEYFINGISQGPCIFFDKNTGAQYISAIKFYKDGIDVFSLNSKWVEEYRNGTRTYAERAHLSNVFVSLY